MQIRPAEEKDLEALVKLNNLEGRWVGEKTIDFFRKYLKQQYLYVVEEEGNISAFMLAMSNSSDYDSQNFIWFKKELKDAFVYIDRLVVLPNRRRQGLDTMLIKKLLEDCQERYLTGEISLKPENPESIRHHERLGFKKKGDFSAYGHDCGMYVLDREKINF